MATDDGPGIRLEPFDGSWLPALAALIRDADVRRFTRVPDPAPPEFPAAWFERYEAGRRDGTREAFAILDQVAGTFLGIAVAPEIDRTSATAELGYVITPVARGRGVATAALRLLTVWAFDELRAERLELLIAPENAGSKAVAARCRYTYEGTLRSFYVKPGVRSDTELWSRLRSDP